MTVISRFFGSVKIVTISAQSEFVFNWDKIVEYNNSLLTIGKILSILNDDANIANLTENDECCASHLHQYESDLFSKKQHLVDSILDIVVFYYYSILDQCILTSYFTMQPEDSFPMKSVEQAISRGYEKLEGFYTSLCESFKNPSFTRGMLTKLLSRLDMEMKERVIRIHYNEVVFQ